MLTLIKTEAGWTITKAVNGLIWWQVSYQTEPEARKMLRRMEEET